MREKNPAAIPLRMTPDIRRTLRTGAVGDSLTKTAPLKTKGAAPAKATPPEKVTSSQNDGAFWLDAVKVRCSPIEQEKPAVLEAKLFGLYFFDELARDAHHSVRQFYKFGCATVLRPALLGGAGSGSHGLAVIRLEVLSRRAVPFQSVGSDHFQSPLDRLSALVLNIHVDVSVRIFPIDSGESALQIHAFRSVELDAESMVRKRGSSSEQDKCRDQQPGPFDSHGALLLTD
jgi:hypothetical protein